MPRYFFHVHDGAFYRDDEGIELADLAAARAFSLKLSGDLLKDGYKEFWNGEDWRMEVTDDKGLTLFTLLFSAVDAPAIRTNLDGGT